MTKKALMILLAAILTTGPAFASLMDETFVVETDEESANDALNRISGDIDLGFTLPEQTYDSENQMKASPFSRQTAFDNAESHGY